MADRRRSGRPDRRRERGSSSASARSRSTSSTRPPRSWCPSRSSCRAVSSCHHADRAACSRARRRLDRVSRSFVPPGLTLRALGPGRPTTASPTSAGAATPAQQAPQASRADGRPAGLDPAPGPAPIRGLPGRRSAASSSAARRRERVRGRRGRGLRPAGVQRARCSSGCATGCWSPGTPGRPRGRSTGRSAAATWRPVDRREPRRAPGSRGSPATATRVLVDGGPRQPAAVARSSAAPPTCCARRGTSPTGCGWSTGRPGVPG